MYSIRITKVMKLMIVIFPPIVTLKRLNLCFELSFDILTKKSKFCEHIRFISQRVNPYKMREIIQKNNVIFDAADTFNRRSPNIRMYQFKRKSSNGVRHIKRKFGMFSKLTCMTQTVSFNVFTRKQMTGN